MGDGNGRPVHTIPMQHSYQHYTPYNPIIPPYSYIHLGCAVQSPPVPLLALFTTYLVHGLHWLDYPMACHTYCCKYNT